MTTVQIAAPNKLWPVKSNLPKGEPPVAHNKENVSSNCYQKITQ